MEKKKFDPVGPVEITNQEPESTGKVGCTESNNGTWRKVNQNSEGLLRSESKDEKKGSRQDAQQRGSKKGVTEKKNSLGKKKNKVAAPTAQGGIRREPTTRPITRK